MRSDSHYDRTTKYYHPNSAHRRMIALIYSSLTRTWQFTQSHEIFDIPLSCVATASHPQTTHAYSHAIHVVNSKRGYCFKIRVKVRSESSYSYHASPMNLTYVSPLSPGSFASRILRTFSGLFNELEFGRPKILPICDWPKSNAPILEDLASGHLDGAAVLTDDSARKWLVAEPNIPARLNDSRVIKLAIVKTPRAGLWTRNPTLTNCDLSGMNIAVPNDETGSFLSARGANIQVVSSLSLNAGKVPSGIDGVVHSGDGETGVRLARNFRGFHALGIEQPDIHLITSARSLARVGSSGANAIIAAGAHVAAQCLHLHASSERQTWAVLHELGVHVVTCPSPPLLGAVHDATSAFHT